MFLQTSSIVQNTTTQKQVFSLWDILFSGGIIGNTIMIAIFLLGILALICFFERYFFIKRSSQENPNFLENIKDCIHDGRIESAIDLCRRTDSPESRMIEKGLTRIGRPISDISNAMQNQGQLEVSKLEKSKHFGFRFWCSTNVGFPRNSSRNDYGIFRDF
jgi:biopolymer transport protein ExbB